MICPSGASPQAKTRPKLLANIRLIMDPNSQAQSHLRTPWSYTHMTAKAVRAALLENGSIEAELPGVRTLSNILNRQGYWLRRVEKSRVQNKRRGRTRSLRM
jgi:hypothetical protein